MAPAPGVLTQGNVLYAGFSYLSQAAGYQAADDVEALGLVLAYLLGHPPACKATEAPRMLLEAKRQYPGSEKLCYATGGFTTVQEGPRN